MRQVGTGLDTLLIEDSPSQARQLQLILERARYRVAVVTDGAAGWQAAYDQLPELTLLDVELPALDVSQRRSQFKRSSATTHNSGNGRLGELPPNHTDPL